MLIETDVVCLYFVVVKHLPKWIPGIHKFKSFAEKCKVLTDELQNSLFDSVKQDMVRVLTFLVRSGDVHT